MTISVPLRSRRARRAKTVQKLQHAIPAFALIASGLNLLKEQPHGFGLALGISEVVVSAVLIVTMARSVRAVTRAPSGEDDHAHGHGVDWVDIWTSAMLFVESAERYQVSHKIVRPSLVTAIGLLLIGLFHGRLLGFFERRRALRVTADEVYVGGKPFRSWRARWDQVAGVTMTERAAEIRTHDGRCRRIDLNDLMNAGEVRQVLAELQRRLPGTAS